MIFAYCFISVLMAWLTYRLIKFPSITPTRASSLLSMIGFVTLIGINKLYPFNVGEYAFLIFGASFVGMCSHKVFNDVHVILGALIFAILFNYIRPHSYNVGGAIGFSAFVSMLLVWGLYNQLGRKNSLES